MPCVLWQFPIPFYPDGYPFAVSRRSIGWGRKQIMDLRSSESHNDDGLGHRKCIKKGLIWNTPNAAIISIIVYCTLLQQASFDRMDSEEQQNGVFLNQNSIDLRDRSSSIGSASSLQASAPLGSFQESCLYAHLGISYHYFMYHVSSNIKSLNNQGE